MRFRRAISALVGFVCLIAGLSAITVVNATADEPSDSHGGVFVPVTPARVYAWDGDLNKRPTPTSPKTFQVSGVAGIPSTGVSAVVLDVSASSGTGVTNVYLRTNPTDTTVSMLTVGEDASVNSNTAIVKPSGTGKVTVAVNNQPVALTIDVQGYFTDSSETGQAGGFVPIAPARLVGTHAGFGLPKAKLNAGTTYTASIAGQADIPANVKAVFANVRVVNSTTDGWIQVGQAGTNLNAIPTGTYYEAGRYTDTGMTFKLGTGGTNSGKVGILLSAGQADVIIDIQGYFTSEGEDGTGFTPLPQTHYYDTRTVSEGALQAGEERTIQVAGKAGIPGDGSAGSIATTILATNWNATGSVTLHNSDLDDVITSNLGFQGPFTGEHAQSTSLVELSDDGELTLRNNSTGTVHVVLAVQGWFSEIEPALPVTTAFGVDSYHLEDLERIAAGEGISLQNAVDRYGWQPQFSEMVGALSDEFPESFSSSEVSTGAVSSAIVRFKGDAPPEAETMASAMPVPVTIVEGEHLNESEKLEVVSAASEAVQDVVGPAEIEASYKRETNRVLAVVHRIESSPALSAASASQSATTLLSSSLPDENVDGVDIQWVESSFAKKTQSVRGGSSLKFNKAGVIMCTSAFTATLKSTGKNGVITADHCPDGLDYSFDVNSLYGASAKLSRSRGDIEFHETRSGHATPATFFYKVGKKRQLKRLLKPSGFGKYCGFGRSSKKTGCYTLIADGVSVTYPDGDTYHNLLKTSGCFAQGGDSGGPWYSGAGALGVTSGREERPVLSDRCYVTPLYGNLTSSDISIKVAR